MSRFQRALRNLLDVFRPAVYADPCALTGRVEFEPELRGDHDLITERSESLADELFVRERAVHLSTVWKKVTPRSTADRRGEIISWRSGAGP